MNTIRLLTPIAPMLMASLLAAQNPAPPAPAEPDSMRAAFPGRPGMMGRPGQGRMMGPRGPMRQAPDPAAAGRRLEVMLRGQLGLNDQQITRFQTAMRANQDRHVALMRRGMDARRAIAGQLQPGVAANADSLNRLLETVSRLGVERAQSDAQFMRDLAFLTPVQRARLMALREQGRAARGPRGIRGGPGPRGAMRGGRSAPRAPRDGEHQRPGARDGRDRHESHDGEAGAIR